MNNEINNELKKMNGEQMDIFISKYLIIVSRELTREKKDIIKKYIYNKYYKYEQC